MICSPSQLSWPLCHHSNGPSLPSPNLSDFFEFFFLPPCSCLVFPVVGEYLLIFCFIFLFCLFFYFLCFFSIGAVFVAVSTCGQFIIPQLCWNTGIASWFLALILFIGVRYVFTIRLILRRYSLGIVLCICLWPIWWPFCSEVLVWCFVYLLYCCTGGPRLTNTWTYEPTLIRYFYYYLLLLLLFLMSDIWTFRISVWKSSHVQDQCQEIEPHVHTATADA